MGTIASQITSLTVVYSTDYSGADQSKHQSSASLAFVWGIHRGPVNSPHKWPVTRKMFPFDDVIMVRAKILVTLWIVGWRKVVVCPAILIDDVVTMKSLPLISHDIKFVGGVDCFNKMSRKPYLFCNNVLLCKSVCTFAIKYFHWFRYYEKNLINNSSMTQLAIHDVVPWYR